MDTLGFLNGLVGRTLCHGLKSPDMDLYDFGFDEAPNRYVLHAVCRFKVIWRNGVRRVDTYYEDTPSEEFHADVKRLLGLTVKRVALSDKNDLWLDFGDYWVVFATHENGEESWRLFVWHSDEPHLVASDSWIEFQ